ncbi:MAG: AMP-binding protein [Bacteroidaceae bacterium]|nr:AMP-binding protein [Bacteroidaceae bacterium]
MQSFIKRFEETVKSCWENPAVGDYRGETYTYRDVAKEIETMHLVWREAGLAPSDKISLNARSSAHWAIVFMAATSGGYVACQLFNGFTAADAQKFVHHSDSRILFTEKAIFEGMDFETMPQVIAVFDMKSFELLASRGDFADIYARREEIFAAAHPDGFGCDAVHYATPSMDELCCLNYTSGSTGNPKGVMLSVRNISSNVQTFGDHFPYRRGETYLSVLPFAHIFGLLADMLICMCSGMHLTVFGMPPAPSILKDAMQLVRPRVAMMVPLVLSKLAEFAIGEFVHSKSGEARLADYKHNPEFCMALRTILLSYMGGNCEVIVTGGAAIPSDVEELLITKLQMPFVTGYGMTECGPVISLGHLGHYKLKSCGEIVERMQTRIDSADPLNTVGEVWVKGDNVFLGYYKNPEADAEVFDKDGWFRTGDLGTIDNDSTLFLVGRCKSMLLSSNGQNVYPEEIEVKLNTLPYVAESVVVQRGEKFVALVVPNAELLAADGISAETYSSVMNKNLDTLNKMIPSYSQIAYFEQRDEAFAKTPKGSIKRYLYK